MPSSDISKITSYLKGSTIQTGIFPINLKGALNCSVEAPVYLDVLDLSENLFINGIDCGYPFYKGFLNRTTTYSTITYYKWDQCLIGSGIDESSIGGPNWLVDGHYKIYATENNLGVILESTGTFASIYPVGSLHTITDLINLNNFSVISSNNSAHVPSNPQCGNPTGAYVKILLSNTNCSTPPDTSTKIYGCMDPSAYNYNSYATVDNKTCIPKIFGCIDSTACNFDSTANTNDESCIYAKRCIATFNSNRWNAPYDTIPQEYTVTASVEYDKACNGDKSNFTGIFNAALTQVSQTFSRRTVTTVTAVLNSSGTTWNGFSTQTQTDTNTGEQIVLTGAWTRGIAGAHSGYYYYAPAPGVGDWVRLQPDNTGYAIVASLTNIGAELNCSIKEPGTVIYNSVFKPYGDGVASGGFIVKARNGIPIAAGSRLVGYRSSADGSISAVVYATLITDGTVEGSYWSGTSKEWLKPITGSPFVLKTPNGNTVASPTLIEGTWTRSYLETVVPPYSFNGIYLMNIQPNVAASNYPNTVVLETVST
jgi:hypothetical protein